jgi:DNA-directed RNA polymerase sigma subunit (sigma70/sigma32)
LDRNRALRERYLLVAKELDEAKARRDHFIERRAQRELDSIGREFVLLNRGLATGLAKPFLSAAGPNGDDYIQSSLQGLWEAFLKWNPDSSTFGTWSRPFVNGRLRREVRKSEFSEISYGDFTARQQVLETVRLLTSQTGREPSDEEVAAHCGETAALVERVRRPQAASLDAQTRSETPLGDLVAASDESYSGSLADVSLSGEDLGDLWATHFRTITKDLTPRELFVFLRRENGADPAQVQTLVELANLTGLGREILRRCEVTAREKVEKATREHVLALTNRLQDG